VDVALGTAISMFAAARAADSGRKLAPDKFRVQADADAALGLRRVGLSARGP